VILGALLLAVLLPAFVSLGLWQWRKAETKTNLQTELDTRSSSLPVAMPTIPADAESLRYRRVVLRGAFDASRQVLIDNRLHQEQAGYHVITPLRLEGSSMHVLVNRGWLPAAADHQILPQAAVPAGAVELTGIAVVPGQRFFNLTPQPISGWDPVWQNLDLERFREVVTYPLQPVVIQLDVDSPAGYVREWPRPDERAERHRSYALQWFGFAAASIGIWAYFLFRRP
jgi:surfeit locus 1 family protein